MTTVTTTQDPVQGLVDYVLDIKPLHAKILEVWVEYIYNDPINATVKDTIDWEIYFDFEQLPGCRYGWDTTPWDLFWNIKDISEIAVGDFSYVDGSHTKTIDKFTVYQLFFAYLTALWMFRSGHGNLEPKQNDTSIQNPFRVLWLPLSSGPGLVVSECAIYWTQTVLSNQFWFDPRLKRLYRHIGNEWVEQPFYYTSVIPEDALIGEYWFSIGVNKLYTRPTDGTVGWVEISKFYISYDVPDAMPTYPEPWKSNWDYPPCPSASGEHLVYTRVTDLLSFEHGTEIFLFDDIRTAIMDPFGSKVSFADYVSRISTTRPIKYRTTVVQTSRNRYKLEREEISAITQPGLVNAGNTTWTIDLNDFELDGWDMLQSRKDVKLGSFLTWKHTDSGTKLIHDNLVNSQTFLSQVVNGNFTLPERIKVDSNAVAIAFPWNTGTVVYLRSTDDLPSYIDPITHKPTLFARYTPYKVVKTAAETFSLALMSSAAMAGQTSLVITTSGSGRIYAGIGYPVPFMEVRDNFVDSVKVNKVKDALASPMEVFEGFIPTQIIDVAVGYTGTDATAYTGFVSKGNFSGHHRGSQIQVGGSAKRENDGLWTVDKVSMYSNAFLGFSPTGVGTPRPSPIWWNVVKLGAWPLPVKRRQTEIDAMVVAGTYSGFGSEYTYEEFSLIAVSNGIPVDTGTPYGFIAEPNYNFTEGSGPNAAHTTISDKLIFGSVREIKHVDGTSSFELELGVPGVSIVLHDRIQAVIQEGLNRDDPYGGQTIGSYDSPFFDQDTYDENLDTIIQRLGSQ